MLSSNGVNTLYVTLKIAAIRNTYSQKNAFHDDGNATLLIVESGRYPGDSGSSDGDVVHDDVDNDVVFVTSDVLINQGSSSNYR